MSCRSAWWSLVCLVVLAESVWAQAPYYSQQAAEADATQPLPYPTFQRRADSQQPPQQAPEAPFQLNPREQAELDRLLAAWEQQSAQVKVFESKFTRLYYDAVFGKKPDEPLIDQGEVKYAAPDKGVFQVFGDQPDHWISDGKSIFQYDFVKKQLIEHRLPPELQGQGITNSPLPFLFGSTAAQLKERYFLRLVTPQNVQGQVWLLAQPRYQADAQTFLQADVILDASTLLPVAIQTHELNGKTRTVYKFDAPVVNPRNPLGKLDVLHVFGPDAFRPTLPRGWTKIVEEPAATQAALPTPGRK